MAQAQDSGDARPERLPFRRRRPTIPAPILVPDDIVPDSALARVNEDQFDHEAIAGRIAELACGAKPPVNIALFGPWGAGKSSVYSIMKQKIEASNRGARVVRYDAWKYGGQSLKRNFITSVARDLGEQDPTYGDGLNQNREQYTLDLWGWLKKNKGSIALAVGLAMTVAAAWLLLSAVVVMQTQHALGYVAALNGQVGSAGTVLGIVLAGALVGPKALESATTKVTQNAPSSDDQFAQHFKELIDDVLGEKRDKGRLVVFIDELDRCRPRMWWQPWLT